ncbi:hypothetical protein F2P56_011246 [Juglans regia]|uniref:Uncharacterized protein LOC108990928 n=2 Tax=Juglans regia TaxID=51240 RepID=A0A2I4EMH7_JUGRE|nr:uncharacterized protein LOC108990928 [Juglans regia]KAF5470755.1 hypothetical protein F2P56_011246 [Juglans regia]
MYIYEKVSLEIHVVVNNALSLKSEFKQLQVFDVPSTQITKVISSKPPPIGFLKLNVDGTTFHDQHTIGIGVLSWDQNGDVLVACSKLERDVVSSEFIEAISMLRGLQICVQWDAPKILLETHFLTLVDALNNHVEYYIDFDFLLQDIRRMMNYYQEVKVLHVNMIGNSVAHQLARHAWSISDNEMWWECPVVKYYTKYTYQR